jgi:muramoyltetrapeptide carboxypeptidase
MPTTQKKVEKAEWVGAFNLPVPRVADHSGARGTRTREPCWGDGGAASCERRGAPVRIALSGRGRRSLQAQGAGAPKPADGHRGTGKTEEAHAVRRKNWARGAREDLDAWKADLAVLRCAARIEKVNAIPRPLPAPLKPGARVGVMAPASPVDPVAVQSGFEFLRSHGFEPVPAPNLTSRTSYVAGPDEDRLAGINALLDEGVEALVAARGGYGMMRLLPRMPWERLAAWNGWVVGFSDITALHAGLSTRFPSATLHGPMVTSLSHDRASGEALLAWLSGHSLRTVFKLGPARVVRPGVVRGVSAGGTLAVLAALVGTPFEPDYRGAVLFLEDVNEPVYRLDRLLTQMRLSSRLAEVKAIVSGRLARCGRGEPGWRERWRTLLLESVPPEVVVVEGLPFGHGGANVPFPLGVQVEVDTVRGEIAWGGA